MFIGEVSTCEREPDNAFNKYAVAIKNEEDTLLDMYLKSFRKSLTSFLKTTVRSKLSALGTDIK